MNRLLTLLVFGSLTLGSFGAAPASRAQVAYAVGAESRLSIDGSATTGRFTCTSTDVRGSGTLAVERPSAAVLVPVKALDCGHGPMNRDLRNALDADDHPAIRFELDDAQVMDETAEGYQLRASGRLHIAGTTRPVAVVLQGERLASGALRATGQVPLRMTDFGIAPPTALLGLVKAQDDILVRFDLVATETVTTAEAGVPR